MVCYTKPALSGFPNALALCFQIIYQIFGVNGDCHISSSLTRYT